MFRIAFDERPGNSGPARYVASLVRGLDRSEWSVQFIEQGSQPAPEALPAPALAPAAKTRLNGQLSRFVPRFAKNWLGFRRQAGRLAGALAPLQADLVHTQNTGCEEMPVAARLARVPRILGTFHVDSTYDLNRQRSDIAHRTLEWYSNRSLHRAIAVSEATARDWIRRTGIPADRVEVIHNGIDPGLFSRRQPKSTARHKLGLPEQALVLGGLGRLDPAKGFAYAIEAMPLLRSEFPEAYLAIAGSGGLREQLEAKAQALGVADRVVFLGFQSDVNLVLDACDVFVLPSLCEALPFALLEAMAHELPAVGTRVGGIPEVIVPDQTGFVAPPRDGAALARAIRPLLESPELRERFGKAGRERVVRHFGESEMVEKTIGVYRKMLVVRQAAKARSA